MLRIFIAENIPSLNKGEMAILDGMLESFRTLGDVKVSMLSARAEIDALRYVSKVEVIDISKSWPLNGGLDCSKSGKIVASIAIMIQHMVFILSYKILGKCVSRLFKSDIWKEYLMADIIIEGHNGTFDIGGSLGIPVFYPLYLPIFAKMLGKPTVLYAGSVPKPNRFRFAIDKLLKLALNNMDLITLREHISHNNLKTIGAKENNVFVTADLAFLLKPAKLNKINKMFKREGLDNCSTKLIGMTITREIASKSQPELGPDKSYYNHICMMGKFIDSITSNYNATFVFVPHCIGFEKNLDDRIPAKDIFEICNNKARVKLIMNEYDAKELKGLIGEFDLFIGERVHSVINAMSMNVPSICISFSNDKRLDILKMIGQESAICYVEDLDANKLTSKFNNIWSNTERIKENLTIEIEKIQNISMHNGELLKGVYEARSK